MLEITQNDFTERTGDTIALKFNNLRYDEAIPEQTWKLP